MLGLYTWNQLRNLGSYPHQARIQSLLKSEAMEHPGMASRNRAKGWNRRAQDAHQSFDVCLSKKISHDMEMPLDNQSKVQHRKPENAVVSGIVPTSCAESSVGLSWKVANDMNTIPNNQSEL